jgi:hypothetical protein
LSHISYVAISLASDYISEARYDIHIIPNIVAEDSVKHLNQPPASFDCFFARSPVAYVSSEDNQIARPVVDFLSSECDGDVVSS